MIMKTEESIMQVNCIGDVCPVPVIKTKKAMKELGENDVLEVIVDNEVAVSNVTKLAQNAGAAVAVDRVGPQEMHLTISMSADAVANLSESTTDGSEECVIPQAKGGRVVAITSATMGTGNDELGKLLMKGFIYALSQLDTPPETVLFYNGGATITTEGSASIEDLRNLEAQGTKIMTCGTCLDYYGIKDKLQVGSVCNMYDIVTTLNDAYSVLRP